MDVDMLYPDVLLPFAAMTLECLDLSSEVDPDRATAGAMF
jgi:hypothetical protein